MPRVARKAPLGMPQPDQTVTELRLWRSFLRCLLMPAHERLHSINPSLFARGGAWVVRCSRPGCLASLICLTALSMNRESFVSVTWLQFSPDRRKTLILPQLIV